jgi:hypothetical protein
MDPLLAWGLLTRGLGVVYAISLFSFSWQLLPLAGVRGLEPLGALLAARRRDFGARAFWYWPTLYWLVGSSDFALTALPFFGGCCGLLAAFGGGGSPLALLGCWAALLSVDAGPSGAVYPWDSLLLEAGFLALWLPITAPLSSGSAAALAAPPPLLSFAFRWLLARVLLGFGKLKFVGSTWADRLYIKNFLINQPMVTPAGWLAHLLLPDAFWVFSLAVMAAAELLAPLLLFSTGAPRLVGGAAIAGLMGGIWLTGNYGYFNVLTMVLCAPAASAGDALTFSWAGDVGGGAWRGAFGAVYLAYVLPASCLQFVMNSWINLSWPFWSGVYRLRLSPALWWTQAYAAALRGLLQWRIVSAYGVFPPASSPPQRWAVVFEGAEAEAGPWRRYEYAFYVSSARTAPRFLAPWHPRLDHAIFYESFGGMGCVLFARALALARAGLSPKPTRPAAARPSPFWGITTPTLSPPPPTCGRACR